LAKSEISRVAAQLSTPKVAALRRKAEFAATRRRLPSRKGDGRLLGLSVGSWLTKQR
jgi:hypothetical protein